MIFKQNRWQKCRLMCAYLNWKGLSFYRQPLFFVFLSLCSYLFLFFYFYYLFLSFFNCLSLSIWISVVTDEFFESNSVIIGEQNTLPDVGDTFIEFNPTYRILRQPRGFWNLSLRGSESNSCISNFLSVHFLTSLFHNHILAEYCLKYLT